MIDVYGRQMMLIGITGFFGDNCATGLEFYDVKATRRYVSKDSQVNFDNTCLPNMLGLVPVSCLAP